jgi:hypothetical protein
MCNGECMKAQIGTDRRGWPKWVLSVAGSLAIVVPFGLGTIVWFGTGFGIMSDCTDKFSCGSDTCAPCATTRHWIDAGGVGQWILLAAAIAALFAGVRLPKGRPTATIIVAAVIVLAITWYAVTTAIAERAY